jgi:HTH-type transcriptional regulator/antitoxin HipB
MNIMKANKTIKPLSQFKDEYYGKVATTKRDKLEKRFEAFKLGALIHEATLEQGLTQEQLADKCGTNKAYISRFENNIKDVRISTLQKIVELGFGGQLELSIKL